MTARTPELILKHAYYAMEPAWDYTKTHNVIIVTAAELIQYFVIARREKRKGKNMIFHNGSKRRKSKYNNTKCEHDGIKFDSEKERYRFIELRIMQTCGLISALELQKDFILIDKIPAAGELPAQRATKYRADFYYFEQETLKWIIEDCKGFKTPVYELKKKLMRARYGVIIREV